MTECDLLKVFKNYIETVVSDMILSARVDQTGKESVKRAPNVFIGALPDKVAERREVPYILLKLLTTKDTDEESEAYIRVVIVTYAQDKLENYMQCISILSRLRLRLLEDGLIGNKYECKKPLETLLYEDDLEVYQIGELMAIFSLPRISRKIEFE